MPDEHQPCPCPSDYCEYDGDTEDLIAGGATIAKAADNAKRKALRAATKAGEAALAAAMAKGDAVCQAPCSAWFKLVIGTPDSQEYPYHSDKRQFAFGWCDWQVIVKCVKDPPRPPKPRPTPPPVPEPQPTPPPIPVPPPIPIPPQPPGEGIAPVPGPDAPRPPR